MKDTPCKNFEKCKTLIEDDKKSSFCQECRSKMGRRSKRKGAANESRFAKYLNGQFEKFKLPYVAKRTPRSGGIQEFEPSDMMFRFLGRKSIFNSIHFELKNCVQWDIIGWIEEAENKEKNMGSFRKPVLVIRKPNMHEEYAVLRMEDLVDILISLDAYLEEK